MQETLVSSYIGSYAFDANQLMIIYEPRHGHADGRTADILLLAQIYLTGDQGIRSPFARGDSGTHGGQDVFVQMD